MNLEENTQNNNESNLRKCKTCDLIQEYNLFPFSGTRNKTTGKRYRRGECRVCYNTRKNEYKIKKKNIIYNMKKILSCMSCGYSKKTNENFNVGALDFHHPKDDKEYTISGMKTSGHSITKVVKEMNKTIVLCCRCHREHHYGSRDIGKLKTLNLNPDNYEIF